MLEQLLQHVVDALRPVLESPLAWFYIIIITPIAVTAALTWEEMDP